MPLPGHDLRHPARSRGAQRAPLPDRDRRRRLRRAAPFRSHEGARARLVVRHRADREGARARRRASDHVARRTSDPEKALRKLDRRLAEAHDSRGPAAYVVFGLGALFALLSLALRSELWGRAALFVGPVALATALALSALEVTRPRNVGLALLVLVAAGAPALAFLTRSRLALAVCAARDLRRIRVRARGLARDELAGRARPAPGRRRALLRDLEPGGDAAPRARACWEPHCSDRPCSRSSPCSCSSSSAPARSAQTAGACSSSRSGYLFLWLRLRRAPLSGRNVALVTGGAILAGLVLVGLDAALGGSSHVTRTLGDGPGALFGELAHRWRVSLDGYVSSWQATVIITASLAVLVWIGLRRPRYAVVDAVLVALAVSLLVNDSPRDVAAVRRDLVRRAALLEREPARSVDSPLVARALLIVARGRSSSPAVAGRRPSQPTGPGRGHAPEGRKRRTRPTARRSSPTTAAAAATRSRSGCDRQDRARSGRGAEGQGRGVHQDVDHRPERRDRAGLPAEHHAPELRIAAHLAADQ